MKDIQKGAVKLNLDENMVNEIAGQLGLRGNAAVSASDLKRLEGMSDRELYANIIKMRDQLAAKGIPYAKQASMLRSLMPMMDEKQRARLRNVIELLER